MDGSAGPPLDSGEEGQRFLAPALPSSQTNVSSEQFLCPAQEKSFQFILKNVLFHPAMIHNEIKTNTITNV